MDYIWTNPKLGSSSSKAWSHSMCIQTRKFLFNDFQCLSELQSSFETFLFHAPYAPGVAFLQFNKKRRIGSQRANLAFPNLHVGWTGFIFPPFNKVWHGHTAGEFQDSWTNHSAMVIACFLVSRRVPKIFGRGLVDSVLLRCGFALICCKARGANALSLSPQCQIGILHCQRAARKISKGHSLLIFFRPR